MDIKDVERYAGNGRGMVPDTQRDVWLQEVFLTTVPACCLTNCDGKVKRVDGKGRIDTDSGLLFHTQQILSTF